VNSQKIYYYQIGNTNLRYILVISTLSNWIYDDIPTARETSSVTCEERWDLFKYQGPIYDLIMLLLFILDLSDDIL
jgi:hypothetical protein